MRVRLHHSKRRFPYLWVIRRRESGRYPPEYAALLGWRRTLRFPQVCGRRPRQVWIFLQVSFPDPGLRCARVSCSCEQHSAFPPLVMHSPETVWYYPQFAFKQSFCWVVHQNESNGCRSDGISFEAATVPAVSRSSLYRQWLRRADLRNCLVSDTRTCDWSVVHFAGHSARYVYGRHVFGQSVCPEDYLPPASSAARLRVSGARYRGAGAHHSSRCTPGRSPLYGVGRERNGEHVVPRHHCRNLPPASDIPDGSDAAGHFAMGGDFTQRRFLAGILLRRQYRRRRCRKSSGGLLSLARV